MSTRAAILFLLGAIAALAAEPIKLGEIEPLTG
jgi:hypothetical protein